MAFTLASNSQSQEELNAVLEAHGMAPTPVEPTELVNNGAVGDLNGKKSEQSSAPGEETPKGTDGEIVPTSDAGDDSVAAQPVKKEAKQQPKTSEPDEHEPSRGKFKAEKQKLRDQIEAKQAELDIERGSKTKLLDQIANLEAKLAEVGKPAEPKPEAQPAGPVKPKRPKLEDFEFDQALYDAALDKYDDDVSTYHAAVAAKTVEDAIAKRDKEVQEKADKEAADRQFSEFVERRQTSAAAIEDFEDTRAEAGDYKVPDMVELAILQSEAPAVLINFFDKDKLENGGKELARIGRLDPIWQTRELAKLEIKLANGTPAAAAPVAKPVVRDAPAAPAAPVAEAAPAPKPKQKVAPEAPIEPLGSRTTGRSPLLSDATDVKSYIALRAQGANRA